MLPSTDEPEQTSGGDDVITQGGRPLVDLDEPATHTDHDGAEEALAAELRLRVRELEAVVEIGQRGLSNVPLDSLLEDAASLVANTLGVELSAIFELRPDQDDLFLRAGVGWPLGLVGSYTQSAHRETQCGYTLQAGSAVIVTDRSHETRFSGPELYHEIGLRAGMSVVIEGLDGPWGVLAAHSRRERRFSEHDISFLQSVANVLGAALQRRTTEAAFLASGQHLELALAAGGLGTWEWDVEAGTMTWSASLEQVFGLEPGTFEGTVDAFLERVVPEDHDAVLAAMRRGVAEGFFRLQLRTVRADGEERWIESRGARLPEVPGTAGHRAGSGRFMGVGVDVTERRQLDELRSRLLDREHAARVAAEAASEQLSFLSDATAALARTLDARSALHTIVRLLVPRLCDWCIVDTVADDGTLHEAAIAHADPGQVELVRESRRRRAEAGGPGLWSVRRTIETGRPELTGEFTDADLAAVAIDADHLELLRKLSPRSAITVPLVARGRILGGITLVVDAERRFQPDTLALAEDLATRAAIALDNARLYEERSRVARTLQESLLPPAMPHIDGLQLAARYQPAGVGSDPGGDFYDLFEAADGTWGVVIGDVCGKGVSAAALSGVVRYSLRAAAVRQRAPSRVLAVVNEVILNQVEDGRFCTALFLRLAPADGAVDVTVSCGGHPEPLLAHADRTVEFVACRGTMLGVFPELSFVDESVTLHAGDALVLYTDGVTEARSNGEIFGEERLASVVRAAVELPATEIATRIEQAVVAFQGGGPPTDDIAILVIQLPPSPG